MEGIGCRWTVLGGHGNTPGLAGKVVTQREDGHPRRNDWASALAGSDGALIETCQPNSQPVAGRPVNHSRVKNRFNKVTGTRPQVHRSWPTRRRGCGKLWEPEHSRSGFPAGAALSIAVARSIAATGFACLLPGRGEPGQGAVVRTAASRALAPLGVDSKLEGGFANLLPPPQRRGASPSERKALSVSKS